jgi:hypothetical protein
MAKHNLENIMVCSFFTADDYYAAHARRLEENLRTIGVSYQISIMERAPGEDWADICRKKVGFLAKVCSENPDKKVFWIDVDCELLDIPDYIINSTADIIGFQRSFGSPLQIGYQNRTRFWEPCFWGVNSSPQGRKMVEDAYLFEQSSTIKATDDFFFEEGWRANANNLTFQLIPSNAVANRGDEIENSRAVFFKFGSSGKVAEFKNQVEQHKSSNNSWKKKLRRKLLSVAKRIQGMLPEAIKDSARHFSDKSGITGALTGDKHIGEIHSSVKNMLTLAKQGKSSEFSEKFDEFRKEKIATNAENRALSSAMSFLHYANHISESTIKLSWWSYPHPGNFGDWLSPYILQHYSQSRIVFQPLADAERSPHIMAVGSIGRFIKRNSIVIGTGISTDNFPLEPKARYTSVRGPRTAEVVKRSGGPSIDTFGDPGILVARIFPVVRGVTNGKIGLVRHHSHLALPVKLSEDMEEISILRSHPSQIEELFISLNRFDAIITSAMHVYITCQSYGIPVALISFKGFESAVHGNGIKYIDYAEGAGVKPRAPQTVPLNLRQIDFDNFINEEKVSSEKMDEVEMSLMEGIATFYDLSKQKQEIQKNKSALNLRNDTETVKH